MYQQKMDKSFFGKPFKVFFVLKTYFLWAVKMLPQINHLL
jgi:hypothetical protein